MEWIEAAVPCSGDEIEPLCDTLTALGIDAISIEDENDFMDFLENNRQYWDYVDETLLESFRGESQIKCWLPNDADRQTLARTLEEKLGRPVMLRVRSDSEWENNWKQYYAPLEIGRRLLVVPEWETPGDTERLVLRLDPGLSFGTGRHATTRMCLEVLQELDLRDGRVLDLGSGSGILGIASPLLGAGSVLACDVDPKAADAARENAALNGLGGKRYETRTADILADGAAWNALGTGYDLVLANIVADVIIPLSVMVPKLLARGGHFLCSGIIDGREAEVEAALRGNGFTVERHFHQEEWHCYFCHTAIPVPPNRRPERQRQR